MVTELTQVIQQTLSQQNELDRLLQAINITDEYLEIRYGQAVIRLYSNGSVVAPLMQNKIFLNKGVVLNDAANLNNLALVEVPEEC